MLSWERQEHVKPIRVDYSNNVRKCTYERDKKPAKDPFADKSLKDRYL
jgi:hypothetical protein